MILELKNIYKDFGTVRVLRGVDLAVDRSEIVSIVGKSGAGKTTLLQIAGTLSTADQGEVLIADQRADKLRGDELARFRAQNIGFVFQFHHLLPEFTALENICIPAYINRQSRAKAMTRARELLVKLDLADRADHKPSSMSGGECQRVAVARALINDPKIIFADEPSGNLDSHNRKELHNLFFDLRKQYGFTFVIVTHDTELAQMSDRQIIMEDGLIK